MRYYVDRGTEVRSENAALPVSQIGKYFADYLRSLAPVSHSADYGTGKGRYVETILETSKRLDVVDSTVQLERKQKFAGKSSTLMDEYKNTNSVSVLSIKQFLDSPEKYDRVFILNVLPVIPIPSIRRNILLRCRSKLKQEGELVIAVNYRNSEFTKSIVSPQSRPHRDGYLINGLRGHYFITLMAPPIVEQMLEELVLRTIDRTRIDGTMIYRAV